MKQATKCHAISSLGSWPGTRSQQAKSWLHNVAFRNLRRRPRFGQDTDTDTDTDILLIGFLSCIRLSRVEDAGQ
ncbi:hypothetical protein E6O75_ATG03944 [Venturia nashicola]|uniref:Uncharacterized protein n=1 Tax=Venturia nashicola TaxID=86259 RepID=A0A4Z1PJW8_9PEZI|nr:hypothetical protein E6O75_ATG03944 [Venturia nashicola]